MSEESKSQALDECRETVQKLEEENAHLRESADAFGHLAERLNETLRAERRTTTDRRRAPREGANRRA
jgi:hypothetical protein